MVAEQVQLLVRVLATWLTELKPSLMASKRACVAACSTGRASSARMRVVASCFRSRELSPGRKDDSPRWPLCVDNEEVKYVKHPQTYQPCTYHRAPAIAKGSQIRWCRQSTSISGVCFRDTNLKRVFIALQRRIDRRL